MAEWLKAPVSKTGISGNRDRGFESRPLRHDWHLFSRLGDASRIMTTNLFSTYRQGENRVTHTFLAVLQRLSLPNMDRILQALLEDSAFSLVTFENQPSGLESTPDAKIATRSSVWIETKTARGAVSLDQIKRHKKSLDAGDYLLVLTPDDEEPDGLRKLGERIVWSNFATMADSIDAILKSEEAPPTETEAFLLRELLSLLQHDGLLDVEQTQVLVVPARVAWPMYQDLNVYRCQPNRSFRECEYIAFYTDRRIQPRVARIKSTIESIDLFRATDTDYSNATEQHQIEDIKRLRGAVESSDWKTEFDGEFKVMFLSRVGDPDTVELKVPIKNDLRNESGRRYAFVQNQRYVPLEALMSARTTSDL